MEIDPHNLPSEVHVLQQIVLQLAGVDAPAHRPDLDLRGDRNGPYIVYDYTGNRSREGPEEFLRGYNGYVQADAYAAYDAMFKNPWRSLTEVAWRAHSRRYFFEAQTSDLCRSTVMLAYIQLLYEVEREARNATAEQRRNYAKRNRV